MSRQIFKYLENEKSFERGMKTFLVIFKALPLKKRKPTFLEDESLTLKGKMAFEGKEYLKEVGLHSSFIYTIM